MTARRYLVSGRVQGVGFRYFVAREAHALGLSGWVRNLTDGRVEVLASGDEPTVGAFEGRLWEGPPFSRVTAVDASDDQPPRWSDFRVLPTQW